MKKAFFIVCFAMLVSNIASAQKVQRYEGEMRLPADLHEFSGFFEGGFDKTGAGSYEYYENEEGDRVKHGKFTASFKRSRFKREISGTYKDGLKNGEWIIRDIITERTNYTKHCEMSITFKDNVLNGPCRYIKNDSPNKYTISCIFENGRLAGNFSMEHIDKWGKDGVINYINGTIGTNGLPEGIWTIKQKGGIEITQKRLYLYGGLVAAEEQDFSTGDKYMVYCAFPNQKKMPVAAEITSTTDGDKECIMYQGQTACKKGFELTDHCFYSDRYDIEEMFKESKHPAFGDLWITQLIDLFPNSMWTDDESVFGAQRDSWAFYYSFLSN